MGFKSTILVRTVYSCLAGLAGGVCFLTFGCGAPRDSIQQTTNSNFSFEKHATNKSSASNAHPFKIKCSEAKEIEYKLLCDALVPIELHDDPAFVENFEITIRLVDLNQDGTKEFVVWESSWAGTSGGSLWILRKTDSRYIPLFETEMTWSPVILLPTSSNGWSDFAYFVNGGGIEPAYVLVRNSGQSYNRSGSSPRQPDGEILIEKNWDSSIFGPK